MRDYCGDYEDIVEFWHRVWIPEYGGKMWVTATDAAFFRWLVGPQSGALCSVAYEGTKLVGSLFSVPHSLRIGSSVHDIGLTFGLTVDPDHRRFALPLVERLHRHNAERGIAFTLGTVAQRSDIALQSVLDKIRTSVSPEPDLSVPGQLLG